MAMEYSNRSQSFLSADTGIVRELIRLLHKCSRTSPACLQDPFDLLRTCESATFFLVVPMLTCRLLAD